jgi:hypothetical protein
MTIDTNGAIYVAYNYYVSPHNIFYFYQMDQNSNILQSKRSATSNY